MTVMKTATKQDFRELLQSVWAQGKVVCVGLDSDRKKLPRHLRRDGGNPEEELLNFNFPIIRETADIVGFYKPNAAPYQKLGNYGIRALRRTIEMIHSEFPGIVVILDSKDTDIGKTNEWYVEMAFDYFKADAVTVNPYFGGKSLKPFLEHEDKGVIVLCRTSNEGAEELQNREIAVKNYTEAKELHLASAVEFYVNGGSGATVPMYQLVAGMAAHRWNEHDNVGVVVGATAPRELLEVRKIVGDGFPILLPGIGTQGGNLEATVNNGRDKSGQGIIVNATSSVIYASSGEDFAEAARREALSLHEGITTRLAAMA